MGGSEVTFERRWGGGGSQERALGVLSPHRKHPSENFISNTKIGWISFDFSVIP